MRILTSLAGQMFPRMFFSQLWILIGLHWSGLAHGDKFHSVPHSIMHSMADSTWFAGERRSESHWRFYSDRITILERVSTGICVKGVKKKKKRLFIQSKPSGGNKRQNEFHLPTTRRPQLPECTASCCTAAPAAAFQGHTHFLPERVGASRALMEQQ